MKNCTFPAPIVPARGFPSSLSSPTLSSPLLPKSWAHPTQTGGLAIPPRSFAIQRIRNRCVAQTSNSESSCSEEEGAVHTCRAVSPVHLDGLSARRVVLERVRMLHSRGNGTSTGHGGGGCSREWFDDSQAFHMQVDSVGGHTSDHEGSYEGVDEATKHGLKRTVQGEVCSRGYDPCGGYEAGDERTEGEEDEPPIYNASKKKPRTADSFGIIEHEKPVLRRLGREDFEATLDMLKTCLTISNAAIPGSQIAHQWPQHTRHVTVQGLRTCPVA